MFTRKTLCWLSVLVTFCLVIITFPPRLPAQSNTATVTIDFEKTLQEWDGFGFNYVEVSQTRDYQKHPQEYGGFSALSEPKRQEILELIFGTDGLRVGVVKMFLDPFHEGLTKAGNDNAAPNVIEMSRFDHTTTTKWMRYFVKEGLKKTRARGSDLQIVTTMYGPPPWATKQKFMRGRDLDPAEKYEVAEYMISWAKYLREVEGLPVKYISLHNEGEDFSRWPVDGKSAGHPNHDYNLYWPPWQVVDFLKLMRQMLDRHGMSDVGVTPGETTNWYRFAQWHYANAIAADADALRSLGLITSHGFTGEGEWYSDWRSNGIDLLRALRPELHAWTTSMTWGKMDAVFADDLRQQVYTAKVNAVIPWAGIQTSNWIGGDPNPGAAFRVLEDCGCYSVLPGYYYYKPITRAGQPGMKVASVTSSDATLRALAFASNGTKHPDAFVIINTDTYTRPAILNDTRPVEIRLRGSRTTRFLAYRTAGGGREKYVPLGEFIASDGALRYDAPQNSVTAFFAQP